MRTVTQQYDAAYPLDQLYEHDENPNRGDDDLVGELIDANGFYGAVIAQAHTGRIIAGHTRWRAAKASGADTLPVLFLEVDDHEARRIMLSDNRARDAAMTDNEALADLLALLSNTDEGLVGTGYVEDDLTDLLAMIDEATPGLSSSLINRGALAARWLVPPFSVLDTRTGWWHERSVAWRQLGIRSELGRGDELLDGLRSAARAQARFQKSEMQWRTTGSSVFDPALAELMLTWFSNPGDTVIDPFAGGSVRGIVAAALGRDYTGIDLRAEQLAENEAQAAEILPDLGAVVPQGSTSRIAQGEAAWMLGDCRDVLPTLGKHSFDIAFTCPPYYDREQYSDDPADLSNMSHAAYDKAYAEIIAATVAAVAPDRFIVWVVSEVRDTRDGDLLRLVPLTVRCFVEAGAHYYNEAILINRYGTLPIRADRYFTASRKLGRTHQNVLVFHTGDPQAATDRLEPIIIDDTVHADEPPPGD